MSKKRRLTEYAYGILKPMKGGKKAHGFTIIETLIVLAVTGGLFIAVAISLSGRQAKTQFEQSIQDVVSQIKQVISDVSVGYYPNANNFTCTATVSGPSFAAGSTEQGSNKGCLFLGKAIQFGESGTDPERFNVFSLAALQRTPLGDEVKDYSEAKPKVVPDSFAGALDTKKLLYGLTVDRMFYGDFPGTSVGSVALVNKLASYNSGNLVSGAQKVSVIPISGSSLNATPSTAAAIINANIGISPVDPDGVTICFASGTTDQSGLVRIGGEERQLSVTLTLKGGKTCGF